MKSVFPPKEIDIPRAAEIDYNDAEEVYAYSQLLGRLLEWYGGLNVPRKYSPVIRALDAEGEYWLTEVKRLLIDGPISAVPDLLEAYMFFHQVCRRREDPRFYKEVRVNAVRRWLGGDRTLSETQVVCLLWPMVCSASRSEEQRYAKYCSSCLGAWINELRKFGRFNDIPDTEAYQRLNYVVNRNLFAFVAGGKEAERAAKISWAKAYMVDDISRLDTAALRAYIPFARTVADLKRTPFEESEAEYEAFSEELGARTDLNPLYREAIRLGVEHRKRLLADYYPEETA